MLKKMRRRVILAAMLAFAAVILMIAVLVNTVNYYVVTKRIDQTVSYLLNSNENAPGAPAPFSLPPEPFMGLSDPESKYMTRYFIVRLDEDNNIVSASTDFISSIDDADAAEYTGRALERKADRGYIREYRYAREETDSGTVIVFLNAVRDQQYMRSLILLTSVVSFVSLIVVLALVILLSGKAIKPIASNIERQKQFITDASHELKTPITSISTSVDVLSLEHGDDEWTDNIRKQTSRMTKLVSELVALSRLDEETPLPNKERFSLSDAAWEIEEVYAPQAKAKGKQLSSDIHDGVFVYGEKAAVQQMMSVLMDNAVRYSDKGGEIRFTVSKKRGGAMIEVFNTCRLGNPPDVDRLFDRFYRPDSSRASETGGTGVGLAIAKAVAETHGGSITAICPDGKTMTIKVTL